MEIVNNNPLQFYYWSIRGVAQPARHLLEFLHVNYVENKCECPKKWFGNQIQQLKKKCVFVSLPYIEDNGVIVSEIVAITKYICKKANRSDLLGKTIQDQARVGEILFKFINNRNKMFQLWNMNTDMSQQSLKIKSQHVFNELMSARYFLPVIELLKKNQWVLGYLTLADFFVFETCFYVTGLWPEESSQFPCLFEFKNRFEAIEQIKKYYESDRPMLRIFMIPNLRAFWKGDPKFL